MRLQFWKKKKVATAPPERRPSTEADRDLLLRRLAAEFSRGAYTFEEYTKQQDRIKNLKSHAEIQTEMRKLQTGFQAVGAVAQIGGAAAEITGTVTDLTGTADSVESVANTSDVAVSAVEGTAEVGEGCADCLEGCACV